MENEFSLGILSFFSPAFVSLPGCFSCVRNFLLVCSGKVKSSVVPLRFSSVFGLERFTVRRSYLASHLLYYIITSVLGYKTPADDLIVPQRCVCTSVQLGVSGTSVHSSANETCLWDDEGESSEKSASLVCVGQELGSGGSDGGGGGKHFSLSGFAGVTTKEPAVRPHGTWPLIKTVEN